VWRGEDETPHILKLATRWKKVVSVSLRPTHVTEIVARIQGFPDRTDVAAQYIQTYGQWPVTEVQTDLKERSPLSV
jgi:hypothetical protein